LVIWNSFEIKKYRYGFRLKIIGDELTFKNLRMV